MLEKSTRATQGAVLVVDDDPWVHRLLTERLGAAQYEVVTASSVREGVDSASAADFDIILLDVGLPDESGLQALRQLKARAIAAGVVMISGDGDAKNVVEAMRLGALDFLTKPLDPEKVLATVGLAARAGRLERENLRLSRKLRELATGSELVGCSPSARRLASVLRRVAESDATVLIEGKPGSGKTTAAEAIHRGGRRSAGPLVPVAADITNAASLEEALTEAERGTLLIEDIDLASTEMQSRLVRFLKERSNQNSPASKADVRVIATTSARLPEQVARGKFREDLYYRLNVFPIVVPSLAERRDDVALLATHFLKQACDAQGSADKGFTAAAMILLESHPWPGNVAQLHNAVVRAAALAHGKPVDSQHLLGPSTGLSVDEVKLPATPTKAAMDEEEEVREQDILPLDAEEKRLLARALKATKGNVRRAAQLLRIGRATLYRKIQVYKLKLQ
ncbi:MAG: sigma-54 dependent transcriptional regulator [Planctomycetota bacterium]